MKKALKHAIRLLREEEAKADRKTENSSEKPNNSTSSKMEQVEDEFKQFDREDLILLIECQKERIAELLAKDEPRKEQNFCGKCRYLYRDFKYGLSCYRLMDNEPCKYEERKDEPQRERNE